MAEETKPVGRTPEQEHYIKAAIDRAASSLSSSIIGAIVDRGGSKADIIDLLGRINATVIVTLVDKEPDARAKITALIKLFGENAQAAAQRVMTMNVLRGGKKG